MFHVVEGLFIFEEVTTPNAMPPRDAGLWRAYGMALLGPPQALEES